MVKVVDLFTHIYTSRVYDSLLPFFLFFTIIYAFLLRARVFKQKNAAVMVSLILALIPVLLHVQGYYARWGLPDIIVVINASLPGVMLWALGIVMLLILIAPTGVTMRFKESQFGYTLGLFLFLASITIVGVIFAGNLGVLPPSLVSQFFLDSDTLQLVLFIAAVAWLVFWLITPSRPKPKKAAREQAKDVDKMIGKLARHLISGVEEDTKKGR